MRIRWYQIVFWGIVAVLAGVALHVYNAKPAEKAPSQDLLSPVEYIAPAEKQNGNTFENLPADLQGKG